MSAHSSTETTPYYGLMAEFDSAQALLDAAHKVREAGYSRTDAYSPMPIHGVAEALGMKERKVAPIILMGGITGMIIGYGLQYWTTVVDFPMNIGGRPLHAWVSFIPPTFEVTILLSAFSAVFGMLILNGALAGRDASSTRRRAVQRRIMPSAFGDGTRLAIVAFPAQAAGSFRHSPGRDGIG